MHPFHGDTNHLFVVVVPPRDFYGVCGKNYKKGKEEKEEKKEKRGEGREGGRERRRRGRGLDINIKL